jgi:subfamily B ATP-binding cassette protein HlyB/CyaB
MPQAANDQGGVDTGLGCLVMILRFQGIACEAQKLRAEFGASGRPFDDIDIIAAAKALGLYGRTVTLPWERLGRMQFPVVAQAKDGHFFIIGKASETGVLVHDPLEPQPRTLERAAFEEVWSGNLIVFKKAPDADGVKLPFGFSWFVPAIIKYRKLLIEVMAASFFLQVFALASPLFFMVIIDKVLVHRGLTTLDVLVLGLVTVSLFDVLLGGLRTYIFSHTTNRIDVELGAKSFRHLLALPISFFEARKVGHIEAQLHELETIRNFLTGPPLTLAIDLLFVFVFLGVMYYYSATLTFIVLVAIPIYVLVSLIVTPILRRRLQEKYARGAENRAFLVEAVSGIETVKAMAVEPQLRQRWEGNLAAYVRSAFSVSNLSTVASQGAGLINKLTTALILWTGAKLVIEGQISVGQLVAFNMLAGRVNGPILRVAQTWQDFQQIRVSIKRLADILDTEPEPAFNPARAALPAMSGKIEFRNVTFRYKPGAQEVLHDVSLAIEPGQVVGIIGPSGSGKSTLTKLIQRLYVPESGNVLVDGIDLATVDTGWLRRQIGVVLQDSYLFTRSIRDNIALANPGASIGAVIEAAKLAGAHDFIAEFPEGYDTQVEEKGRSLSGGQRQRIAIARALMTNPRILILDEATSALDYESETVVQENLRQMAEGRTVIIISHRFAMLSDVDRIITVEHGRIVEDGDHVALVQGGGHYAHLYRHQVGRHVKSV